MSAAPDYCISELLCVLNNYHPEMTKLTIINILSEFYSEVEIGDALRIIVEVVKRNPQADEVLKKIKPRVGDKKHVREVEDIFVIYSFLQEKKVTLPHLLAADIGRIPSSTDVDLLKLRASLTSMGTRVDELSETLGKFKELGAGFGAQGGAAVKIAALVDKVDALQTTMAINNSISDSRQTSGSMWNTIVGGRAVPANSISSEAAQHHMAPTLPQRTPRPPRLFETRTAITGNAKIASAGVKKFVIFCGKDR